MKVNTRDPRLQTTPLHCAAHRGFREIVQDLLEAGADVMSREGCSETIPLHWAAEGGHLEVARLLIGHGSSVNTLDSWHNLGPVGWATVVQHAHRRNAARNEVAEFLLNHGAELDIFTAIVMNNRDAVQRLTTANPAMPKQQLGVVDNWQQPLHFAVVNNLSEMAQLLLDLGADINAKTAWGLTPLCLAVMSKHEQIEGLLRDRHAEVDLSAALLLGQFDRAKEVLKADPSLVGPASPYRLLLHFTVEQNLPEATEILLSHGADPNTITEHFYDEIIYPISPLHLAARHGQLEIARILVGHGADRQHKDDHYKSTPFIWAKWHHQNEVAEFLGS